MQVPRGDLGKRVSGLNPQHPHQKSQTYSGRPPGPRAAMAARPGRTRARAPAGATREALRSQSCRPAPHSARGWSLPRSLLAIPRVTRSCRYLTRLTSGRRFPGNLSGLLSAGAAPSQQQHRGTRRELRDTSPPQLPHVSAGQTQRAGRAGSCAGEKPGLEIRAG